jgi:hypothetical protein
MIAVATLFGGGAESMTVAGRSTLRRQPRSVVSASRAAVSANVRSSGHRSRNPQLVQWACRLAWTFIIRVFPAQARELGASAVRT